MKKSDVLIAVLVLAIIMLIIIPLSPAVMDILLITNISLSLMILLFSLYMKETLEFSTYPTLLLLITLFRLALNISSTRLILSNGGDAGQVIATFGSFVVGKNIVVGFVIFLIIVLIQFIVITKGAERVSEVAARFTLDAMPGKQMAIDADLSSGIIDENTARKRRLDIQREADFYGAMDGASKFVKGDSIVGIIITFINIIGGIIIGLLGVGGSSMTFDKVLQVYTLATVGDGLCSQLPALMVSTATGIIVTRSGNDHTFGESLASQLFSKPAVAFVLSGMLVVISLVPGLPTVPMLIMAALIAVSAYAKIRKTKQQEEKIQQTSTEQTAIERRKPESVTELLNIDLIEMEFGYGLLSLVDTAQGGDLLDRVVMIRRQCAMDLGIVVPVVHLRDNIQLDNSAYSIKIRGLEVAHGEVMAGRFMVLKPADATDDLEGIPTTEPTFGLPALWIPEGAREKAEILGYTTIDAPSVIATHLMETIKRHASELLSRQQVQTLLDHVRESEAALVDEIVPKLFSVGEIQRVLACLLDENISIRDMVTILEEISDHAGTTRDPALLAEYVRQGMKRAITHAYAKDGAMHVITLDASLEQMINENIKQSDQGQYLALDPTQMQKILKGLKKAAERAMNLGLTPIVLTSPNIRRHFRRITAQFNRDIVVLSFNEIEHGIQIFSDGVIK